MRERIFFARAILAVAAIVIAVTLGGCAAGRIVARECLANISRC
jgi:hypothetical protein